MITRLAADAGVGALGAAAVAVAVGAAVTLCATGAVAASATTGAGSLTAAAGTVTLGEGAVAALGAGAVSFGDRTRTRSEPATPVARAAWASSGEAAGAGFLRVLLCSPRFLLDAAGAGFFVRLAAERRVGADDEACAAGAAEVSVG